MTANEIFIVLGVVVLLWCLAIRISLWRVNGCGTRPPTPEPVPDRFSTVLVWCQGCGHRHRTMWMEWTPENTYRCNSCCGTPIPERSTR